MWDTERIRVVIRANEGNEVEDYSYERAAQDSWRISQLLEKRIQPLVGGQEVVVLQGNFEQPHGRVTLRTLRASYTTNNSA